MPSISDDILNTVFGGATTNPSIIQGLTLLAQLPALDIENQLPSPYRNKRFTPATLGFRFVGKELKIAVAAHGTMPQLIPVMKYIAMIEQMNNPKFNLVVVQTHSFPAEKRDGRPQILGRILPEHSAINIVHGKVGVPIYDQDDIMHLDSYQIDRSVLGAYYLAAKLQIGNDHQLDSLFATYEGTRFYELPSGRDEAVDMARLSTLLG